MIPRKTTLGGSKLAPKKTLKKSKGILRKKKKAWKFVKTELDECDAAFSREIIARDGHCMYKAGTYSCPATTNLTCSHYIGRAKWITRFDPANCITLCTRHHFFDRDVAWEFQKARKEVHGWDGQYTLFMKEWLGEETFRAFMIYATTMQKTRKEAIIETQKKYELRQDKLSTPTIDET